jgi:hypothetical protein
LPFVEARYVAYASHVVICPRAAAHASIVWPLLLVPGSDTLGHEKARRAAHVVVLPAKSACMSKVSHCARTLHAAVARSLHCCASALPLLLVVPLDEVPPDDVPPLEALSPPPPPELELVHATKIVVAAIEARSEAASLVIAEAPSSNRAEVGAVRTRQDIRDFEG